MMKNLKVGQKIQAITLLVGLILAVLLGVTYFSFIDLRRGLEEVKNESMPDTIVAKDMQMQVVQIQQWLTDISATRGQDGLDDGFKEAEKAHQLFLDDLAKIHAYYEKNKNQAGIDQVEKIKERMAAWYEIGKKMAQAYVEGGALAGNVVMYQFDTESTQLQVALERAHFLVGGGGSIIEKEIVKSLIHPC